MGLAATTFVRIALWNTLPNGKRATFYTIYTFKKKHPEWFREDLALLLGLLAKGRIQPIVAERLPLEEVVRAHELRESAGQDRAPAQRLERVWREAVPVS